MGKCTYKNPSVFALPFPTWQGGHPPLHPPDAMAIYSLNMRSVGKSTHAPRSAGAHLRYITRPGAQAEVMSERMPEERNAARAWLDWQERADRKNARVIDKLIMALPRELHPLQRRKLVREFAERLTQGVASWFVAIHQVGKDAGNPHCHLVIRDRDPVTGKRVAMLSEKGACKRVRQLWEETCNEFLRKAGIRQRISCRSYQDRGIDRVPTRHRGPYRGVNENGRTNPPKKNYAPVRASMAFRASGASDGRRRQRHGLGGWASPCP